VHQVFMPFAGEVCWRDDEQPLAPHHVDFAAACASVRASEDSAGVHAGANPLLLPLPALARFHLAPVKRYVHVRAVCLRSHVCACRVGVEGLDTLRLERRAKIAHNTTPIATTSSTGITDRDRA
jgi:hypothetical protein